MKSNVNTYLDFTRLYFHDLQGISICFLLMSKLQLIGGQGFIHWYDCKSFTLAIYFYFKYQRQEGFQPQSKWCFTLRIYFTSKYQRQVRRE